MNREILFRGQPTGKGGIWMVGIGAYKTHTAEHLVLNAKCDCVEVVHLCQYTGLKDSTGKEIYEGDILQDEHDSKIRHIVKYDNSICSYTAWCPLVHNNWEKGNIISKEWINECGKIVIGNIHDNLEMVEGDE